MATEYKWLLVDEDGEMFGTNSDEIADAAEDVGFAKYESAEIHELDADSVMPDEEG